MKGKIDKLKLKLKDKKEVFKQVNKDRKEDIQNFFQACGIRTVNY